MGDDGDEDAGKVACQICTLLNDPANRLCEACGSQLPVAPPAARLETIDEATRQADELLDGVPDTMPDLVTDGVPGDGALTGDEGSKTDDDDPDGVVQEHVPLPWVQAQEKLDDVKDLFLRSAYIYFAPVRLACQVVMDYNTRAESLDFAQRCFYGVFKIMLKQHNLKAPDLANCVTAIRCAVEYVVYLITEKGDMSCASTLNLMLSPRHLMWTGELRADGARTSHSKETYEWLVGLVQTSVVPVLVRTLRQEEWIGCERASFIVSTLGTLGGLGLEGYSAETAQADAQDCVTRILALPDAVMKRESTQHLNTLLRSLAKAFEAKSEVPDRLCLRVYLHCLLCQSLPLRIFGLEQITAMCKAVMPHATSDLDVTLTGDQLVDWIRSPDAQLLQHLVGDRLHPQLLNRCNNAVILLAQRQSLTSDDILMIWGASLGAHESVADTVRGLLVEICMHGDTELTKLFLDFLRTSCTTTAKFANVVRMVARFKPLKMNTEREAVCNQLLVDMYWDVLTHPLAPLYRPDTPDTAADTDDVGEDVPGGDASGAGRARSGSAAGARGVVRRDTVTETELRTITDKYMLALNQLPDDAYTEQLLRCVSFVPTATTGYAALSSATPDAVTSDPMLWVYHLFYLLVVRMATSGITLPSPSVRQDPMFPLLSLIQTVHNEHKFVHGVFEELQGFVAALRTPPTLCVRQRLSFVRFLLAQSRLKLNMDWVVQIWDSVRHWAAGRELFWNWLTGIMAPTTRKGIPANLTGGDDPSFPSATREMRTIATSYEAMAEVLSAEQLRKSFVQLFGLEGHEGVVNLEGEPLGPHGYECFQSLFLNVNIPHHIQKHTVVQDVGAGTSTAHVGLAPATADGSNPVGLTTLQHVALAGVPLVANQAAALLVSLYLAQGGSDHTLVHHIVDQLSTHVAVLAAAPKSGKKGRRVKSPAAAGAAPPPQTLALAVYRTRRCLEVIHMYMAKCGVVTGGASHGRRSGDILLPPAATGDDASAGAGAAVVDSHAATLTACDDEWMPDACVTKVVVEAGAAASPEVPLAVGEYDVLFQVMASNVDDATKTKVWNLLMTLPTSGAVLESLENPARVNWAGVFPANASWRTLYMLQAVAAILRSESAAAAGTCPWRTKFFAAGGLRHIVATFVMQDGDAPVLGGALHTAIRATALRVVRVCARALTPDDIGTTHNTLFGCLLRYLAAAHPCQSKHDTAVSLDALMTMTMVVSRRADTKTLSSLLRASTKSAVLTRALCGSLSAQVRGIVCKHVLLPLVAKASTRALLSKVLLQELDNSPPAVATCTELLAAVAGVVAASESTDEVSGWVSALLRRLRSWCLPRAVAAPDGDASTVASADDGDDDGDGGGVRPRALLVGVLTQLTTLLPLYAARGASVLDVAVPLVPLPHEEDDKGDAVPVATAVSEFIMDACLFAVPTTANGGLPPLCRVPQERAAAFGVLSAVLQAVPPAPAGMDCHPFVGVVVRRVCEESKGGPLPLPDGYQWSYSCSNDGKSEAGFVGLRNLGCTCYLNACVQQVYMCPALRQGILAAGPDVPMDIVEPVAAPAPATVDTGVGGSPPPDVAAGGGVAGGGDDPSAPAAAPGDAAAVPGDAVPGDAAAVPGDAAPGDTAPADAAPGDAEAAAGELAVAAPAPSGPDAAGGEALPTGGAAAGGEAPPTDASGSAPPGGAGDEPPPAELTAGQKKYMHEASMLLELQRTMLWLRKGEGRAYDPTAFVDACGGLGLEFAVRHQNDASEFFDKLIACLERRLVETPQAAVMRKVFGGRLVTQQLRSCCDNTSEKVEPLVFLSLDITGKANIADALQASVQGELMAGDNAVWCDSCQAKSATRLRRCLDKLPQLLVLHLQRFSLDYTTFTTRKINDKCTFPFRINMRPYTKQGLQAAEAASGATARPGAGSGTSGDGDDESKSGPAAAPVPTSPATPTRSVSSASGAGGGGGGDDDGDEYELVGVLVHQGTAQAGHYYSFVKDRRSKRWFKFDDQVVQTFNSAKIPEECFGGTTMVRVRQQYPPYTEWEAPQPVEKNALMCFYERRGGVVVDDGEGDGEAGGEEGEDTGPGSAEDRTEPPPGAVLVPTADVLAAEETKVLSSNEHVVMQSHRFDEELFGFFANTVKLATPNAREPGSAPPDAVFQGAVFTLFHSAMRAANKAPCHAIMTELGTVMEGQPWLALWLLQLVMVGATPTPPPAAQSGGVPGGDTPLHADLFPSALDPLLAPCLLLNTNLPSRRAFLTLLTVAIRVAAQDPKEAAALQADVDSRMGTSTMYDRAAAARTACASSRRATTKASTAYEVATHANALAAQSVGDAKLDVDTAGHDLRVAEERARAARAALEEFLAGAGDDDASTVDVGEGDGEQVLAGVPSPVAAQPPAAPEGVPEAGGVPPDGTPSEEEAGREDGEVEAGPEAGSDDDPEAVGGGQAEASAAQAASEGGDATPPGDTASPAPERQRLEATLAGAEASVKHRAALLTAYTERLESAQENFVQCEKDLDAARTARSEAMQAYTAARDELYMAEAEVQSLEDALPPPTSVVGRLLARCLQLMPLCDRAWKHFDEFFQLFHNCAELGGIVSVYLAVSDVVPAFVRYYTGPGAVLGDTFSPNWRPLVSTVLSLYRNHRAGLHRSAATAVEDSDFLDKLLSDDMCAALGVDLVKLRVLPSIVEYFAAKDVGARGGDAGAEETKGGGEEEGGQESKADSEVCDPLTEAALTPAVAEGAATPKPPAMPRLLHWLIGLVHSRGWFQRLYVDALAELVADVEPRHRREFTAMVVSKASGGVLDLPMTRQRTLLHVAASWRPQRLAGAMQPQIEPRAASCVARVLLKLAAMGIVEGDGSTPEPRMYLDTHLPDWHGLVLRSAHESPRVVQATGREATLMNPGLSSAMPTSTSPDRDTPTTQLGKLAHVLALRRKLRGEIVAAMGVPTPRPVLTEPVPDDYPNMVYKVSGSASPAHNGLYIGRGAVMEGAQSFDRALGTTVITLYRARMTTGGYRWYISQLAAKSARARDADFFTHISASLEPPATGWENFKDRTRAEGLRVERVHPPPPPVEEGSAEAEAGLAVTAPELAASVRPMGGAFGLEDQAWPARGIPDDSSEDASDLGDQTANIKQITDMGFAEADALRALRRCGDVELAIEDLLGTAM